MSNWIHDFARELARDPLPEDAERMASALVSEAKRGDLEAERALCAVRLNRNGREPIQAIEDWLDHALALRFIGHHENWNACMRPDKHGAKILPEHAVREARRWLVSLAIVYAVDDARAAGYPKSLERPAKTDTPTAFEVACEALKAEYGPRMPSGSILTPDAVRKEYQKARRHITNNGRNQ
jgi:hypothetical protein